MKKEVFSLEELSLMETIEIKGGTSDIIVTQHHCPTNNAAGCGCPTTILDA